MSKHYLPHLLVLGCAGLAALFFFAAMRLLAEDRFLPTNRPATDAEAIVAVAMEYAAHSREANDVIAIGDSTCLAAFLPREFEQATGLRAWNLGTFGSTSFLGFRYVLEQYLVHHPRPRLVLLGIHPSAEAW